MEFDRIVRALDFGPTINRVGRPMLALGGGAVFVVEQGTSASNSSLEPGTFGPVSAQRDGALSTTIGTRDGDVSIVGRCFAYAGCSGVRPRWARRTFDGHYRCRRAPGCSRRRLFETKPTGATRLPRCTRSSWAARLSTNHLRPQLAPHVEATLPDPTRSGPGRGLSRRLPVGPCGVSDKAASISG